MSFKFEIPEKEVEEWKDWRKEHDKVCTQINVGAIGGRFTVSFTSTGLGDIIKIKCSCGEELDLTHSERW